MKPPWERRLIRQTIRCRPFGLRRTGRPSFLIAARVMVEPRDLWIGVYWTIPDSRWPRRIEVYVCPLPTLVLHVTYRGAR